MKYLLALILVCCMGLTPVYVNPTDGNDTNSGATWELAKKTLTRAAGDAYSVVDDNGTIIIKDGTYTRDAYVLIDRAISVTITSETPNGCTIQTSDATRCVNAEPGCTDGTKILKFKDINISCPTAAGITIGAAYSVKIDLEGVNLDTGTGMLISIPSHATDLRSVSLLNCNFNSNHVTPIAVGNASLFKYKNCLFTGTGSGNSKIFNLTGTHNIIDVSDSSITCKTSCFYPIGLTSFKSLCFRNNIVNIAPTVGSQRVFGLPDIPCGNIVVENNTVTQTGEQYFKPISIGTESTYSTNKIRGPKIIGNKVTMPNPGVWGDSYSIYVGSNVINPAILNNEVAGGYVGIFTAGHGNLIYANKVSASNGMFMFGSRASMIVGNTFVTNGTAGSSGIFDGRTIVFGRQVWYPVTAPGNVLGTAANNGERNTEYTPTTVHFTNAPDLTAAAAALADGTKVLAYTFTVDGQSKWQVSYGVASIINDTTDTVTVADWLDFNGSASSADPTNGDPIWLVAFPDTLTVFNNILDCSKGVFGFTFDYLPINTEHKFDYNLYRAGSSSFTNLGVEAGNNGTKISTLDELKTKWASWQVIYTTNDSHSLDTDPKLTTDYRLLNGSPALGAGYPKFNGEYGPTIGAWQPRNGMERFIDLRR